MNYKSCWEKFKNKITSVHYVARDDKDKTFTTVTTVVLLDLIKQIEKEVQEEEKLHLIYIRNVFNEHSEFLFRGSKENLMTLIGCLHSTSLVEIKRIDYREVKAIPQHISQEMKYIIQNDNVYVVTSYIEREVQDDT